MWLDDEQIQLMVGQALSSDGKLREAEGHFCEAGEWRMAVAMYRDKVGRWLPAQL